MIAGINRLLHYSAFCDDCQCSAAVLSGFFVITNDPFHFLDSCTNGVSKGKDGIHGANVSDREEWTSPANVQSQREKSSPQNQLNSEHISCVQGTTVFFRLHSLFMIFFMQYCLKVITFFSQVFSTSIFSSTAV